MIMKAVLTLPGCIGELGLNPVATRANRECHQNKKDSPMIHCKHVETAQEPVCFVRVLISGKFRAGSYQAEHPILREIGKPLP